MERGPQMANRIEGKAVDKTSIKHFIKLIRAAKPRYLFFIIGILAGIVGTLIQLQVPKMVQPLVNSFGHGVNGGKVALVIALYIGSAAVSAIAAIVLGIFGESVVKNLRTRVWDKMIHLPVKYFDEVKTGEMSSRLATSFYVYFTFGWFNCLHASDAMAFDPCHDYCCSSSYAHYVPDYDFWPKNWAN